jgi:hypothetical protein
MHLASRHDLKAVASIGGKVAVEIIKVGEGGVGGQKNLFVEEEK